MVEKRGKEEDEKATIRSYICFSKRERQLEEDEEK